MKTEAGNQVAVVANQIIRSCHKLDARQAKVLWWAISQIARDDTEFMTHTLHVAEFAKLTDAENSGQIYAQMSRVTRSLLREILEIHINDGDRTRVEFQWLSHCIYKKGNGTVEIRFHEKLKPYLLELQNRFTQVRTESFMRLKSSYTMRFFERIEMQRGLNRMSWKMSLDELRDWLGIDAKSYPKFGLLRAYVIDISQRELDAKSDWSFSFELSKTGRKIVGVEFLIRAARTPNKIPSRELWKKSSPALKQRVIEHAKSLMRWAQSTDEQIFADDNFWEHVGEFLDEVKGQKTLKLD